MNYTCRTKIYSESCSNQIPSVIDGGPRTDRSRSRRYQLYTELMSIHEALHLLNIPLLLLEFTQARLCFCSAEIKRTIYPVMNFPTEERGWKWRKQNRGKYFLHISSDVNLHIPVLYIDLYPDLPWCSCHQFFPGLSMDCTLHFCRPVTERNQRVGFLP